MGVLGLSTKLSEVVVFSPRAWPVACEDAWVGACGLSIKLDGQGVDGDGDIGVEETVHPNSGRKSVGLGKVLMFRK